MPGSVTERPESGRSTEPYDVVVVGSGIGGLTAGAVLAKAGQRVVVVERSDGLGGYAHVFRRGPYIFDPAVHWTMQAGEGELYDLLLQHLGVRDRCTMLRVDSGYDIVFPDFRLRAPFEFGTEEFVERHVAEFPHEAEGIRRFFDLCVRMQREIHGVSMSIGLQNLDEAVTQFPTLFTYRTSTVADVLDECLTDPRAKAVCAATWPYGGSPPSRLAFLPFAQILVNQLESCYYCEGSFQNLVDALAAAVELHGGAIVTGNAVERINVESGAATGVTLADGRELRAPIVISNADARHTFEDLVGIEHLPERFVKRLLRLEPSLSAFIVFAATTLDVTQFEVAHEMFVNETWDHEASYMGILEGRPGGVWINVPTPLDPSLAPRGEHLVIISSLAAYDVGTSWEARKGRFTEQLLAYGERVIPDLRSHLSFVDSATPLTLERYTLNARGSTYGWENTPGQTGTKRLAHETPIPGLYLSGHWSLPGGGSIRVLTSGLHTAAIILRWLGQAHLLPDFRSADLPTV